MATVASIVGDVVVSGTLTPTTLAIPSSYTNTWPRASLTEEVGAKYQLSFFDMHTDEATPAPLGATASGKLALVRGTIGTDQIMLQTPDCKSNGGVAPYVALAKFSIPPEYSAAGTFQVALRVKMVTTVADTSATCDVECWESAADGTVGSDICATAAQSMNSLTSATKTFTITATTLAAGDDLTFRITLAVRDNAGGAAVIASIIEAYVLANIKG